MKNTLIIAEAGVNHNGDIETAKRLIDVAADSGVDYVKFQTFKAENLVTKIGKKALYQQKLTSDKETHFEMLKALEINEDFHYALINHCKLFNIKFLVFKLFFFIKSKSTLGFLFKFNTSKKLLS